MSETAPHTDKRIFLIIILLFFFFQSSGKKLELRNEGLKASISSEIGRIRDREIDEMRKR